MTDLFLKVLNLSFSATWVVLGVVIARLLLKKAPRNLVCALWALVALRLLFGGIEAPVSLIPSAEIIPPDSLFDQAPVIHSGISTIDNAVNPVYSESLRPAPGASVNPLQVCLAVFANLWVLGMGAMSLWAGISCIRVRRQVRESLLDDGVYLCDRIASPFIFGLFRPKIYLPSGLGGASLAHVIAHEKAHIARRDHWWKPLGFALLAVNWFNPAMWLAYVLLCRDIEMACDEKVIRDLGVEEKKAYSAALLGCSVNSRPITACPLAFGEVGVKQRVRSVLHYKKPAFWIILLAAVLTVVLAVGLLTDPESPTPEIRWGGMLYAQEGRSVKALPQDAVEVGTLAGIEPYSTNAQQQGFAVNLSENYVGHRLYLSGETLYLTEIGGEKWIPFEQSHHPADAYDLFSEKIQCQLVLRGNTVSHTEFLPQHDRQYIRELLAPGQISMEPHADWDPMVMLDRYDFETVLSINDPDFTRQCLLIRRENDWLMVYQDETWRGSGWTFQSPELDALIASRQAELAFNTELFAPFATAEAPIYLDSNEVTMLEISARWAVPDYALGSVTTDTHWERQSSVSYEDKTIHLMCRPFEQGTWMNIWYYDSEDARYTALLQSEPITLANGTTGTLYHSGDPARWELIRLDTTRGQLLVELDTTHGPVDWAEEDYRMALAILSTLRLTQNGNSLFGTPADDETMSLGIRLQVEDVTANGARLVCTQDGTYWDEIITGAPWNLERLEDGQWGSVMPESTAWTAIAYGIKPGATTSWELNWGMIVGSIGPGTYRVSKTFTGQRRHTSADDREKQEVRQTCYAEFTIGTGEPTLQLASGFSDAMHQALRENLDRYLAMSQEQRFSSSTMPGHCIRDFDDWNSVEAFVGFPIPNPLENLEGLEHGCWAGTPVGYNGASRFHITWYGNLEGHVHWVNIDSGYRRDGMRVCVGAALYSDPPENISYDKGWSIEHERLFYLENSVNGGTVITEDSNEEFEARTAFLARGPILYSIRVIGELGSTDAIDALLQELLPHFEALPVG